MYGIRCKPDIRAFHTQRPDLINNLPPVVLAQIKNGGATMPAGLASGKEAKDIADYVAKATGG